MLWKSKSTKILVSIVSPISKDGADNEDDKDDDQGKDGQDHQHHRVEFQLAVIVFTILEKSTAGNFKLFVTTLYLSEQYQPELTDQ